MLSTAPAAVTEKLGLSFSVSVAILSSHLAPPSYSCGPQGLGSEFAPTLTCEDLGIFLNGSLCVNRIQCGHRSQSFYPIVSGSGC